MRTLPLCLGLALCLTGPVRSVAQQPNKSGDSGTSLTDRQLVLKARAMAATQNYLAIIQKYSSAFGLDPALIMAVITVESDGDTNSVSSAGALGLMQLMPENCTDYQVENPYDPDQNIRGGVALLANLSRRYKGDLQKVLAGYNAGPRHADDGSWVLITETRHYVPKVLAIYAALKGSIDNLLPFQDEPPVTIQTPDPAKYVIPGPDYEQMVYEALRTSVNVSDPASLAENGDFEDAATAVLGDDLDGHLTDSGLQTRALRALKSTHRVPKALKVFRFVTPDPSDFTTHWDKLPKTTGTLMGSAHAATGHGHVWVVVIGQF